MGTARRRLIGACGLLVLLGTFLWWLTSPSPGVNRVGFQLLREGMTETEVVLHLRVPPGDYVTGPRRIRVRQGLTDSRIVEMPIHEFQNIERSPLVKTWYGDDGVIMLQFTPDGRVSGKAFYEIAKDEVPFITRVRRWLNL